ncbi:MAG: Gfo/Idh/MocA family oxidoreductase [Pirellulales bacterium]
MRQQTSRRNFLQGTAVAGLGYWTAGGVQAKESKSPNERIQFGCIGIGGKGSSDSADAGKNGDVIAICDIDEKRLNNAAKSKFKGARKYFDYRKMLDEMEGKIDAVTVSTPDHNHAPASVMAMRKKIHCFCQKPMTRTLHEARVMAEVARENNLATEMGNQGTALAGLRRAAATVQAGTLGTVSEVHVWTNRPVWPQGGPRPKASEVPAHVNWDLWVGPSPMRLYAKGYHPFAWRGYWDFGSGALGDMACHTSNMAFAALDLRDPISVEAESSGHNGDSFPKWSVIDYEFAATDKRPGLKMVWYDGGKLPDKELLDGNVAKGSGSVIIGDKGSLYSPNDYGAEYQLLGGVEQPEVDFEESPGHFTEWVRAIRGGKPAMSNFSDYAGPLTETILLGNLAVWSGKKVIWDAKTQQAKGTDSLDQIIRPEYRQGYSL